MVRRDSGAYLFPAPSLFRIILNYGLPVARSAIIVIFVGSSTVQRLCGVQRVGPVLMACRIGACSAPRFLRVLGQQAIG